MLLNCVIVGLVTTLSIQCGDTPTPTEATDGRAQEQSATTVSLYQNTAISYVLGWSWGDAEYVEGRGYRLTNDLGYQFTIKALRVTTGALELRPCEQSALRSPTPSLSLGVASAFADHSADQDASRAFRTISEAAHDGDLAYADALTSGQPYCSLHVLFAPGIDDAQDGFDMRGHSIVIEGSYQAPNTTEDVPFSVSVNLKNGGLNSIRSVCDLNVTRPTVKVIRRPARAFDGLAPDKVVSYEFAYRVALRLASSVDAVVHLPGTVSCP